ncbi:PREDICTED: GDSL esterase/lipase At5g14450-like [Erythranthe guttata]|uniref:GDSL esterase/lipase At5g14450-like n=1 Tax=Erythranthe guttata TaxID=4155 RepID=UPI00064DFE14|nr:PREDICTED: GDSL esterase/lipase At5g14450-like [Erythranthe guttata]|eukprot:XP_012840489.1 PREDICTED: GDSL esterase/lipase At5g14450-like [Erythranthe guttata]
MTMELPVVLVLWFVFSLTVITNGDETIDLPPCDYSAIYNFGDSNSDTGGLAAALYPEGPPSGETYFKMPAGRASDGRLIIDFIGKRFNSIILLRFFVLYERGARAFWVHNTGPIGCLPVTHAKVKDPLPGYLDEIGCVKDQNDVALLFNQQLKVEIVKLRAELTNATLVYVDMYAAKYELISQAKNQGELLKFAGFEDRFEICCGYHGIDYDVWCGNKGNVNGTEVYAGSCANPSAVISWDGVHYTEAANRWIANRIMNGSLSDPMVPISRACHKQMPVS